MFRYQSCTERGLQGAKVANGPSELLPRFSTLTAEGCGIFLLHFPWSRLHRALPGVLPYGARTFLALADAVICSAQFKTLCHGNEDSPAVLTGDQMISLSDLNGDAGRQLHVAAVAAALL